MAKNIKDNTPITGLNKDNHISTFEKGQYTNALNCNIQSKDGSKFYMTSDPSNLLTTQIKKKGYKIVGVKPNYNKEEVYVFITNPNTRLSEVGRIPMITDEETMKEESDYIKELSEEDLTLLEIVNEYTSADVIGFKEYETIIKDCEENICLGFDIDKPIHTIEVRNEVSGTKISWTFGEMPMTLDMGKLDELNYTGNDFCGEGEIEDTCLDCDKLKVFRDYKQIILREDSLIEGSLDKAKYEFYAAYCSMDGIEETEYHSQTVSINLNDVNNTEIDVTDLETNSGNGIKLSVDSIDPKRKFFKVVLSKTTSGGTRFYNIGVFNTSTEEIVINQDPEGSGVPTISSEKVRVKKTPHYISSERIKEIDGTLTHVNVKKEKEWNLQPVVNLMGFFAEWSTIEVSEEFYKNQIPSESMKSDMRDETYPKAISFETKTGFQTAKFPLISRPAIEGEEYNERRKVFYEDPEGKYEIDGVKHSIKEEDKRVVESIITGKTECSTEERTEHWQYYNTAGEGSIVPTYKPSDKRAKGDEYLYITSEEVGYLLNPSSAQGSFKNPCDQGQNIQFGFNFVIDADLFGEYKGVDYIIKNYREDIQAFCKTENLTDSDKTILYLKYILTDKWEEYVESDNLKPVPTPEDFGQDCDCENDCEETNCDEIKTGVCCECPEEKEDGRRIEFREIEGEELDIEYTDVEDYSNPPTPSNCYMMETDDEGKLVREGLFEEHFLDRSSKAFDLFERMPSNVSTNYSGAINIIEDTNDVTVTQPSYYLDYEKPMPEYTEYEPDPDKFVIIDQEGVPDYRELFSQDSRFQPENLPLGWDGDETEDGITYRYHGKAQKQPLNLDTRFYPGITTNAAWFKINVEELDSVVLKLSDFNFQKTERRSPFKEYGGKGVESYRITLYSNLNGNGFIESEIRSTKRQYKKGFNFTNSPDGSETDDKGFKYIGNIDSGEIYVVIDTPITRVNSYDSEEDIKDITKEPRLEGNQPHKLKRRHIEFTWHNAPEGCFTISFEPKRVERTTVNFDKTPIDIQQTYKSVCHYSVPDPDDCKPQMYQKGLFAFNESTELYPNNKELYDSSWLKINPEDIPANVEIGGDNFKTRFERFCTEGVNSGDYKLKNLDFTCQGIRHFRYPDNSVSPIMPSFKIAPFSNTSVFPIGFYLNEKVIETFLDLAVKNKLINQKQRDSITSYTIYTGDRSGHKSILSKGLSFDMYKYEEDRDINFSNFPFNTLGHNRFIKGKDGEYIKHPYNSEKNNRFSVMTPEIYNSWRGNPTEMKVEGYMYGNSENQIAEVKEHPKQVVLGSKARALATNFAIAEALAEIALDALAGSETYRIDVGVVVSLNPVGIIQTIFNVIDATSKFTSRMSRYRYEWLKSFEDQGKPINFAYRTAGVGKYTNMTKAPINLEHLPKRIYDNTRGLLSNQKLDSTTEIIPDLNGERDYINNIDREESIFVKTNGYIDYPSNYQSYDNTDISEANSGRITHSNAATEGTVQRNVSSPYVSLKTYMPSQYGKISNIRWMRTGFTKEFGKDCRKGFAPVAFGGDTYIARFADIRKTSLFSNTAMGLPDRVPFQYSRYPMYGSQTTYYLDHKVNDENFFRNEMIPDILNEYNFDMQTGVSEFYVKEPSKIYLYSYGIINYIVESEYNPFYRYSEKGKPDTKFYPQTKDYIKLTEESLIPIQNKNTLLYNRVYRQKGSQDTGRTLDNKYNSKEEEYKASGQNTIVTSQKNNEDFKTYDPWKIYEASDYTSYDNNSGKLQDIIKLTSNQIVLRFENNLSVVNSQTDLRNQKDNIGANIFRAPKVDFANSLIGYAGTQNKSYLNTEYGTVVLDTVRGDVFLINAKPDSAPDLQEISKQFGGKQTYMDRWFQENLPFHILTDKIENHQEINIDNNFNGVGVSMGYDSIHKQLLITKKDYYPKVKGIEYIDGEFYHEDYDNDEEVIKIIEENEQEGWQLAPWVRYSKERLTFIKEEKVTTRECIEEIKIKAIYREKKKAVPEGICYGGHLCDRSNYNININGVTVGEVSLNNRKNSAYNKDNTPPFEDWNPEQNPERDSERDRYSEIKLTDAQIDSIIDSGEKLDISLDCNCIKGVNCSSDRCHEDKTWIILEVDGTEIYSGCPNGNFIEGLNPCPENKRTKIKEKTVRIPGIDLDNEEFFENTSWTISFNFESGSWGSFFSFKPDFYVNTPLYFQTGKNKGEESTIWTHGMTNRSFNTYYNKEEPWMVEMPTNFMITDNRIEVIKYMMESKRHNGYGYHNYTINERIGMDRAVITGLKSSSGELILKPIETPWQRSLYPIKIEGKAAQEIPQTYSRGTWSFNYFYDRLKEGHQIWEHKKDGHSKEIINESHDYERRQLKRIEDVSGELLLESKDTKHNKQLIIELIDETPRTER